MARAHNFKELYYLTFEGQEAYEPKKSLMMSHDFKATEEVKL